jgi:hypothetical protein
VPARKTSNVGITQQVELAQQCEQQRAQGTTLHVLEHHSSINSGAGKACKNTTKGQ